MISLALAACENRRFSDYLFIWVYSFDSIGLPAAFVVLSICSIHRIVRPALKESQEPLSDEVHWKLQFNWAGFGKFRNRRLSFPFRIERFWSDVPIKTKSNGLSALEEERSQTFVKIFSFFEHPSLIDLVDFGPKQFRLAAYKVFFWLQILSVQCHVRLTVRPAAVGQCPFSTDNVSQ